MTDEPFFQFVCDYVLEAKERDEAERRLISLYSICVVGLYAVDKRYSKEDTLLNLYELGKFILREEYSKIKLELIDGEKNERDDS